MHPTVSARLAMAHAHAHATCQRHFLQYTLCADDCVCRWTVCVREGGGGLKVLMHTNPAYTGGVRCVRVTV